MFEPAGLRVDDAHGDRIELIEPAAQHASARVHFPDVQIRPPYAAVVATELQADLGVRPATAGPFSFLLSVAQLILDRELAL
jgi:hypothetical protein